MKHTIPTYDLNGISRHGILVEKIEHRLRSSDEALMDKGIHRDSHYIFTSMESGYVKMMVDFKIIESRQPSIFCVLPGQVHQGLVMERVNGWFIAVKADLLPDAVRTVFEESLEKIRPIPLDENWIHRISTSAKILHSSYSDEVLLSKEGYLVVQSLLNAFTGMFAYIYSKEIHSGEPVENRALQLTRAFRSMVRKEFKTMKSPSEYAERLNISRGYLTEAVREITGKPAQYWIHQEVLTEAKRLLVFTHLTVKEIAYKLGYSDHTYFSRLFSKSEDQSPSEFRNKNRNPL
ncbi:AraC family transcriptional regulator [Chryseobacterium flavum]|uniref:AraC family transcriptional regulator n=1 Tax=Chryseobacterium flavum TaxID=415851 RepID=A0A3D9CQ50_9FLAO|nr:AraC family transcriptional regulator [Chryseobacterium flavum]REC67936.1 AraC family transcriptional regulator [Chryseobacterium flavum]